MLVSFSTPSLGRPFELIVLLARAEHSKELEIVDVRHELSIPAPSGRASASVLVHRDA